METVGVAGAYLHTLLAQELLGGSLLVGVEALD
jgi:hypothetical protein